MKDNVTRRKVLLRKRSEKVKVGFISWEKVEMIERLPISIAGFFYMLFCLCFVNNNNNNNNCNNNNWESEI